MPDLQPDDELILRSLRAETSRTEEARLRAWRAASPENERHYQDLAAISRLAPLLSKGREADPPPSAVELMERASALTEAALARQGRGGRRLRWWHAGAAAAAVAAIATVAWWFVPRRTPTLGPDEVVTGPNETTTVALRDGSVVRLAPNSKLRIQASAARQVSLNGRAFFEVAKSPDRRPFLIQTRAGEANVLGTAFEMLAGEDHLRVIVIRGHVALKSGTAQVDLRDGEMSQVVNGTVAKPVKLRDALAEIRWLGRFLVFQATPLPEAARELHRVYGVRVVIVDSALARQAITGWYADKSFEEVLGIICTVLAARCKVQEGVASIGQN